MRKTGWIVAAGVVFILATPVRYLAESRAADRCSEAGGSYNYAEGVCDHEQSHPVLPWARRNRALVMLSAAGFGMILISVATARIRPSENA
jgi:hypothetical protein